ncbi:MAG: 50S ribosomal protein L1 [bacterium]
MAQRHGKKYNSVKSKVEAKVYEIEEAISFLKSNPVAKFDESVDLAARLDVDPTKTDQAVRGIVRLPHGSGKEVRVVAFARGAAIEAAKKAGADQAGFEDLIEKVKGGWTDFDVAVATPEAMQEVKKLGKVLGPRGLMPNPKTGTVNEDIAAAVEQCKAGRVEFRMDRHGNVHVPVGKLSFDAVKLTENAKAVIEGIKAERPPAAKGVFVKKWTMSSTMGVGLRIMVRE